MTPAQYVERSLRGRKVTEAAREKMIAYVREMLGENPSFADSNINVLWLERLIAEGKP